MKKTLIQAKDLDNYVCKAAPKIFIDVSSTLLTPGAKDELRKRGVSILPGSCPKAGVCALHSGAGENASSMADSIRDPAFEKLIFSVAAILQTEYGITDLEQLQTLSAKAAEAIRKHV